MALRTIKACLIANPKSGRGGVDLSQAITILRANGWEVTLFQKLHGGHATELARDAVKEGYNVVVDCGGDGTLNEIVEGVVGTDVAVGTLPGGTANLWAHEVGIARHLPVAATQLVGAQRHRVDVGSVHVNGHHNHHFLLMAGLGIDGAVIGHLSKPLKKRIGPLAYLPATIRSLGLLRSIPVSIEMDEVQWHGRVVQIIVGNARRYAGFTRITADAFIDDGLLDLCLLTPTGPVSLARQMTALLLRQRPSPATAQVYRAASITIRSPAILPTQVDGGHVHVPDEEMTAQGVIYTFSLVPQGVCMLVPRTYDGTLFQPDHLSHLLAGAPLHALVAPQRTDGQAIAHLTDGHGNDRHRAKTWHMQVVTAGVDSITAMHMKDGRVAQVHVDTSTLLSNEKGEEQLLWGSLSTMTEGEQITVTGYKDPEHGTINATHVALHHDTSTKRQMQAH